MAKFKNSHEVRRKQRRVCVSLCVCACVCAPVSVCLCVIYKNLLLLLNFVVLPSLFFFSPVVVECFYSFCVVRTDKQSNSRIERQRERGTHARTHKQAKKPPQKISEKQKQKPPKLANSLRLASDNNCCCCCLFA